MSVDPRGYLDAALERLDLLLHREVLRLRARYKLSLDEFRGLYVSDEQVDRLVRRTVREPQPDVGELTERAEAERRRLLARRDAATPWLGLVRALGLSAFEEDVVLLAVAPELDLKYETIYAYLNDDVGRKWPTFDLALRVAPGEPVEARRALLPEGTLFGSGLLRLLEPSPQHPARLAAGFRPSPLALRFLLGLPLAHEPGHALTSGTVDEQGTHPELPPATAEAIERAAELCADGGDTPVVALEGRPGSGRAAAAAALAGALERPLLRLDLDRLDRSGEPFRELAHKVTLRQRLRPAVLIAGPVRAWLDAEGRPSPEGRAAAMALHAVPGPLLLEGEPRTPWRDLLPSARQVVLRFDDPARDDRRRLWRRELAASAGEAGSLEAALDALSDRFVLNGGQIRRVVAAAADATHLEGGEGLAADALFRAARAESRGRLGRLGVKVECPHRWDDLVLPRTVLDNLHGVAAAIEHRHRVYESWGFAARLGTGRGLKALFAGSPGTGKTMAAGVIARELRLDLYKVDLSGVVSKYIGETEKNLDRIFRAAHTSNAILFFDEADALFGKRSEVRDAHDRYANIEVSYLLQKMDEHEGAVVLASNLRGNIDEAFARRLHYVVEFPMPDERHRERLWRGMFPAEAPLADEVDLAFLARQFAFTGGDIRNVALDAAFLAARNGGRIGMRELVRAVARQQRKQGRLLSVTEFGQYQRLLEEG